MFLDDYEPLHEIASSDLSQVYLAKRYDNGKQVLVKVGVPKGSVLGPLKLMIITARIDGTKRIFWAGIVYLPY